VTAGSGSRPPPRAGTTTGHEHAAATPGHPTPRGTTTGHEHAAATPGHPTPRGTTTGHQHAAATPGHPTPRGTTTGHEHAAATPGHPTPRGTTTGHQHAAATPGHPTPRGTTTGHEHAAATPGHPAPGAGASAAATAGDRLAATVGGEPVWATEIDAELDRLRAGPQAHRLPAADTQDGRQLRRWVAQRVVLRRLLESAARREHRNGEGVRFNETQFRDPLRADPAVLGAATADVLATSPAAHAVYAAVTADEPAPEPDLRAYYQRNLDRYTHPERWTVRFARSRAALANATPVPVDPATLPATLRAALATANPGQAIAINDQVAATDAEPSGTKPSGDKPSGTKRAGVAGGDVTYAALDQARPAGVRPYGEVRDEIAAAVLDRRRQVAFARWVDARAAALIRLEPGYEHPADPGNPDATHRH
jgi:[acyl-carrier-protein] S-malonyltransferase